MNRLAAGFVFCLAFGLLAGGCAPAKFKEPLANYQQSVAKSTAVLEAYYRNLNQHARDAYLNERLNDPTLSVVEKVGEGKDEQYTPLVHAVFSPAGIQARLDALNALGLLAQRLSDLAGSDAPARTAAGINALGANMDRLVATINAAAPSDPTVGKYAGPVSLIAQLAQKGLELARDKDVADFIIKSEPSVTSILNFLESDLAGLGKAYVDRCDTELTQVVMVYEEVRRTKMSRTTRQKYLDEINLAAQRLVSARLNRPELVIGSVRKSFDALVAYAKDYKNIKTWAQMVETITTQAAFIEQFSAQIAALKAAPTK
ncbi:hypothetical protein [Fundidesulfovibrio agrisoli]|uniref:hypothetical protein n=1 Tax=Fundidesulfovibrio agrisoli TaxID=2922717 RepID=UPI001FACDEFA|nr:hypothetical protein [Fundidesulfovibrio agrisoli]